MARRVTIKEIREKAGASHPDPPYGTDVLPGHEFSMLIIAPRGSGKTTLILNLLSDVYKNYFNKIHVFSPTMAGDAKWETVRAMKGILKKNPHADLMNKDSNTGGTPQDESSDEEDKEGKKAPGTVKAPPPQYTFNTSWQSVFAPVHMEPRYQVGGAGPAGSQAPHALPPPGLTKRGHSKKEFDGKLLKKHMHAHYDESDLQEVMDTQMSEIKRLKRHGKTKHAADRQLLVFDDLVGSNLFSGKKDNPFIRLNTTMRHYSTSAVMVTQAYKAVPKVVRVNASVLILFAISNHAELESIYEENSVGLKKETWMELYKECTAEPFSFMTINYMVC